MSSAGGGRVGESAREFMKFWKCKVVPATQVTAWRVLENKLATKGNLKKRRIRVVSPVCVFCGGGGVLFTFVL